MADTADTQLFQGNLSVQRAMPRGAKTWLHMALASVRKLCMVRVGQGLLEEEYVYYLGYWNAFPLLHAIVRIGEVAPDSCKFHPLPAPSCVTLENCNSCQEYLRTWIGG